MKDNGKWYIQRKLNVSEREFYAVSKDASESPFTEGLSWYLFNISKFDLPLGPKAMQVYMLKNCAGELDCFL